MTEKDLVDWTVGMAKSIEAHFDHRTADPYSTYVCSSIAAYFYCEASLLERAQKRWQDHVTNACIKMCRGEA